MYPLKKVIPILFIVFLLLAACATQSGSSPTPVTTTETVTPLPTATTTRVLPTPSSLSDSILWDDLQVTMDQIEITNEYLTDFGSTRTPPEGRKFLWVHIRLKNTGQIEMDVPVYEHYSILYAATEIKPIYGHRNGRVDYTTLDPVIFPNQELDGWLRFDIPISAELEEVRFVFIPESAQVGVSYSSPNYPYAENKPTYVWDCGR